MNEIEKLIQTTSQQHDGARSAATFWVVLAVLGNIVIPILLVGGLVLAVCFMK
jgi:hypothetical protein